MAGQSLAGLTTAPPAPPEQAGREGRSHAARFGRAAWRFLRDELLVSVTALIVGAALWQMIAILVDASWLPTFWSVLSNCRELLADPAFRSALGESLYDVLIGYGISVGLGGIIGIGMGLSRYVDWAFVYYLDLLLFVPRRRAHNP